MVVGSLSNWIYSKLTEPVLERNPDDKGRLEGRLITIWSPQHIILKKKHRKNCECCPGHSSVSVYASLSVSFSAPVFASVSQKCLKSLPKISQKSLKSLSKVSQKSLKSLSKVSQRPLKSHCRWNQKSVWLTHWVTRSPIELSWTAKKKTKPTWKLM